MADAYHHPPELVTLLVETVPRICRSKRDVLLFFRGAGVPEAMLADLTRRVTGDGPTVSKFEIARTVLARVNEGGDALLSARREVVKRVAEFDDFGQCWPDDQLEARGLVARVREVVNVKDTFTRLNLEREQERRAHREARGRAAAERAAAVQRRDHVTRALFACFGEGDAQRRGKPLEAALNDVFALDGLLVREALQRRVVTLALLEEIVGVLQRGGDLAALLRTKVIAAMLDKQPYVATLT